jgi:hypothetical protein
MDRTWNGLHANEVQNGPLFCPNGVTFHQYDDASLLSGVIKFWKMCGWQGEFKKG